MNDDQLIQNLYKMPWEKNNNPNGWIEVTTHCQLSCDGCYRGLDKENTVRDHESLDVLKQQVDDLVRKRNVECISIAGGEPLLYPQLEELIVYIRSRGCYCLIFTNAIALDESLCANLNNCGGGLITFLAHVSSYQGRGNNIDSRKQLIELIRNYSNLRIAFTQIMSPENLTELPEILRFDNDCNKDIAFHLFTLRKNLADSTQSNDLVSLDCSKMVDTIREVMPFEPSAYLPTTSNPKAISWLLTLPVFFGKRTLGYLDAEVMEYLAKRYYKRKGNFAHVQKTNVLNFSWMLNLLVFKSMRKIFRNYLKELALNPFGQLLPTFHLIIFVKPPEKDAHGEWSLCDGCPDAMFHNGKLVPSCLLERVKSGEPIEV